MKNIFPIIGLVSMSILFSGCPYESIVPIDSPSVNMNPNFFGTWQDTTHNDSYKISKKDEFTYKIEKINKEPKDKNTYFAYTSLVNGIPFLNVWPDEPKDSAKKYFFYRMILYPDGTLSLAEITENVDEHFSWSSDLKKFIIANMNHSFFYGRDELNLKRVNK